MELKFNGDTLGQRHRNYNKFFAEITNTQSKEILSDIDVNVDDVHNLFKVDVACRNRDVQYILKVLKGNDLVYVSRAIKLCDWLITDSQYAHIINPEYLTSQLLPLMMTKAVSKLMLSIRLHLRDEDRVKDFFNYYENHDLDTALKWLPRCSAGFIELKVEEHFKSINPKLLSILCEKNANALKIMAGKANQPGVRFYEFLHQTKFLLNTHMDFYLDIIESYQCKFNYFNSKHTKLIMTHRPQRIREKFSKYANFVHIPTFVKFLNPNEIMDFLLKQANQKKKKYPINYIVRKTAENLQWLTIYNKSYFLERIPEEERVALIREVFSQNKPDSERLILYSRLRQIIPYYNDNDYFLLMPFETAFLEIKEKIKLITDADQKHHLLAYLPQIVGNNPQCIEELLKYYNDNFLKEKAEYLVTFANKLCVYTDSFKYNARCWSLLNEIFISMKVYDEDCERYTFYAEIISVQAIIVYKVINKQEMPDILKDRINFDTLKTYYRKRLNSRDHEVLVSFLYDYFINKLQYYDFKNPKLFDECKSLLLLTLQFINEWQLNLGNSPYVLSKIKDLVQMNKELKKDLWWIYDINKTWRKLLFEQSILLCPSQKVCMNALKHDPSLLSRYDEEVAQLRCKDTISLNQLLYKLKIYWPESLASEWAQAYRARLGEPDGHKALMRGLCCLLPRGDMLNLINQYKPRNTKIDWIEDNETTLSLTKHLAKNMHYARPQPEPDMILEYAKGDYLQYALPSLHAIVLNLSPARGRELVPRLLDAPVSLQKQGVRLAFAKMQSQDLQQTFAKYWKNIQNVSLRSVTFKRTYSLLCKEGNPEKISSIWALLSVFIDGLTYEEDKTIYELLSKVNEIPHQVKPLYVVKSYKFLKSFLPESGTDRCYYESSLNCLLSVVADLTESDSIDSEFVADILLEYMTTEFTSEEMDTCIDHNVATLMVSYVLYTKSRDEQTRRYESVLVPALNHMLAVWENQNENNAACNFTLIWDLLRGKFSDAVKKNMAIPVNIVTDVLSKLEKSLNHTKHYLLLRQLKLIHAFVTILNEKQTTAADDASCSCWDDLCEKVIPEFSNICVQFLKDDIKLYFPCIYEYFSKALMTVMDDIFTPKLMVEFFKHFLIVDFIPTYLLVIDIMPLQSGYIKKYIEHLQQEILSHPSLEVKMHFYHRNKDVGYRI